MSISADNFIAPRRIGGANFKIPSFKKRSVTTTLRNKKKKLLKRTTETESTVIDTRGLAQVLQKYTIYIDDSIKEKDKLRIIAEGMGGTVKQNRQDTSIGIYIIQPKGKEKDKLISSLIKKGIKPISPVWLYTCYQKNDHIPPDIYPHAVKSDKKGLRLDPVSDKMNQEHDNPFGLEPVNYDYLEQNKPGRQLNLDNYITIESNNESDETYQPTEEEEQPTDDNNDNDDNDDEADDEDDDMRKEIAYNMYKKKRSLISTEEKESRKKASEKRRMDIIKAAKVLETKSSSSRRKREVKKEKYDVPSSSSSSSSFNHHNMDKMKIWYAEQPLPK